MQRMTESVNGNGLMSVDEFCAYLAEALELMPGPMSLRTHLYDDLDLDSLQMQELGLVMYELGAEVIEEMVPSLETIGDLYHLYTSRVSAETGSRW